MNYLRSETTIQAGALAPAFRYFRHFVNGNATIGANNQTVLPRTNLFKAVALLFLSFICCSSALAPHAPDVSSTMLSQQKDGTWILQVRSALTAFEREINYHCGAKSYDTPEAFKELVIEHVQKNLSIAFNENEAAKLTKGFVKLGHETNVIFTVSEVPENFFYVTVKNSSFKDIYRSQSALMIFREGFKKQQFILNRKNSYTTNLAVRTSNFELIN